jgi:hypothetical protein
MRKHLYLITEHENEEYVGTIQSTDMRLDYPLKNEEGAYTVFNEETGEFRDVGKKVGVGYHDFTEEEWNDNSHVADVFKRKLEEIDDKWIDKAGLEL